MESEGTKKNEAPKAPKPQMCLCGQQPATKNFGMCEYCYDRYQEAKSEI